ncbi:UNVERIFIED_CONTAM: Glycosyltransferase BC10 [Sesamum radiatum]|uniref:Glycosyltransferase BC10 n=1 Tax=Sesamum radiatum TaxID=300843 RepID=A0AAW2TT33_SESRA
MPKGSITPRKKSETVLLDGIKVSIHMIRYFGVYSAVSPIRPNLLPRNGEELGNLDQWINPPSTLMHNMSDKELFGGHHLFPVWRSIRLKRVPKIAFMFLTKGPLPLAPLWERFFKGNEGRYSIYIHSLPLLNLISHLHPFFTRDKYRVSYDLVCQQGWYMVAEWGKMSMCDAERRLLANALLDISNERFVLLSESCIPLYNFTMTYKYIMRSKLASWAHLTNQAHMGRTIRREHVARVNITEWRKGSQWFEINRKLALYVIEDTKFYPKFDEFCQPACYVDEHYFPLC